LVDDDQSLLDSLKMIVEIMTEHRAILAKSLNEVIALGETALNCDSVILDIRLRAGKPSGIDVYHWLRTQGFTRTIHFLTGHSPDQPEVIEASGLVNTKVHFKPINANLLVKIIRGDPT